MEKGQKNIAVLPLHISESGVKKDKIFEKDAIFKMSRTERI